MLHQKLILILVETFMFSGDKTLCVCCVGVELC